MPLKGSKQSPEHIAKRLAARKANGTDKGYKITKEGASERYSAASKRRWEQGIGGGNSNGGGFAPGSNHSPETIEKMREIRRQMWADGRYDNKQPANRRRVSNMERSLIPYLEKLGYQHNDQDENTTFISCNDRTRVPDFIDFDNRRVFEFFGNFWHHPDDEPVWKHEYAAKDWDCTILWEDELQEWLESHKDLVTEEQHRSAIAASRARNRYRGRGNSQVAR